MRHADAQRLAFGTVAAAYERHRPGYAPEVVDRLLGAAPPQPGDRVLEIGAGTGKLTVALAARGLDVLAVEPSPGMAEILRARRLPGVRIADSDFESLAPVPEPMALVVSAAAWHWLDPARRCALACAHLARGGTLAAVWTFPDWERVAARPQLAAVYRAHAPQLAPEFPMHPDSAPTALAAGWVAETEGSRHFADATVEVVAGELVLDAAAYTGLLRTHQDHILLPAPTRERLLAALADTVAGAEPRGRLRLATQTWVCRATAT